MKIRFTLFLSVLFIAVVFTVFIFSSKNNELNAQDEKPANAKSSNEDEVIERFCMSMKNHDLDKLRTCFAVTTFEQFRLDRENSRQIKYYYAHMFNEKGTLARFINGDFDDIDYRLIKVIDYSYEITKANNLGVGSFHFKFNYGADTKLYEVKFDANLLKVRNQWYLFTGMYGDESLYEFFEMIDDIFEKAVKPDRRPNSSKKYNDYREREGESPKEEPAKEETKECK